MKAKHTPGEWHVGGCQTGPTTCVTSPFCGGKNWPYQTVQCGAETIAVCPAQAKDRVVGMKGEPDVGTDKANAELIVRAVNAHADLLAACKLLDSVDCCTGYTLSDADYPKFWEALEAARAAIAKAEGDNTRGY